MMSYYILTGFNVHVPVEEQDKDINDKLKKKKETRPSPSSTTCILNKF
jgi:hypothetical protein